MILAVKVLGHELLRIELGQEQRKDESSEETVAHRHAGHFDFGFSPARPYWSSDPGEAPAVVRGPA